jgi:DNA-binding XRE family transcriptional regulator
MTPLQFRATRLSLGMTQAALAEALGLSWQSVCRKENRHQIITARDEKMLEQLTAGNTRTKQRR